MPAGDPAAAGRVFLSPHKFIGGPGTPGRAGREPQAADELGSGCRRRRHRRLRQPARAPLPHRPGPPRGGRARPRSSSRSAPASSSGSRTRSASPTIHALERRPPAACPRGVGRASDDRGARQPGRPSGSRSCRSSSSDPGGRYLHHNVVVAILNDLFGIQSRGGCSCAGPYGHRLLGIDLERSHEFEREITGGCEGIKPGWVRVSFNYFISDAVFEYIVRAVAAGRRARLQARAAVPLLDSSPGCGGTRTVRSSRRCGSRSSPTTPRGGSPSPRHDDRAPESALAGYLAEAVALFASLPDPYADGEPAHVADERVSDDFEHLRWFDLPAVPGAAGDAGVPVPDFCTSHRNIPVEAPKSPVNR